MVISRYIDKGDGAPADLLEFIHKAFDNGDGVAVEAGSQELLDRIPLCSPCSTGDYSGSYVFRGVSERSRRAQLFDTLLAFVGVVVLMPLFFLIFLLILLLDGLPVVFRQKRYGVDNRDFNIYKFRTMVLNGEDLHGKMQRRWGKEGQLFKLDKDPRATPLGSLLRATYLDELPQLFNVLKGDMRFCGPRPLPESDAHHYTAEYHNLRLLGLPGITGLWQLSAHYELTFDEMCILDLYYLCNNNLWMDVKILLRTVKLLFTHHS